MFYLFVCFHDGKWRGGGEIKIDVVSLYLTGMGLHQGGAFSSFQDDKLSRYLYADRSSGGQYKLQSLAYPSAVLLKILIQLQQWSPLELWRQMCFRMLLLFWGLFLSYSLFMQILTCQKYLEAGAVHSTKLNRMLKPLSELKASLDLGYPEYSTLRHTLKLRILLE